MKDTAIYSPVFASDSHLIAVLEVPGKESMFRYDIEDGSCDFSPYQHIVNAQFPSISCIGTMTFSGNIVGNRPGRGLFTSKLDGSDCVLRCWLDGESDESFDRAVFSPDGNQILFTRINGEKDGVYILDLNKKIPRKLVRNGCAPCWSPDGRLIACFVNEWKGKRGEFIVIVSLDDGQARLVCEGCIPQWSPDGKHLCFTVRRFSKHTNWARIGMVDATGANRHWLTPEESDAFFPQWSSKGDHLYFSMDADICALRLADMAIEPVVVSEGSRLWVEDISPDGRWLAYGAEKEENQVSSEITRSAYIVDIPSGKIRDLTAHFIPELETSSSSFSTIQQCSSSPPEPSKTEPNFIFISYKREDLPRIVPLMHKIVSWGFPIWYDRGIPGGAEWDTLIEEKVSQCQALLVFLSEAAVESKWVRREIKFADSENRPILGIRLDKNVQLKHGLKVVMNQYQMIDICNEDFSDELRKAIEYVRLL